MKHAKIYVSLISGDTYKTVNPNPSTQAYVYMWNIVSEIPKIFFILTKNSIKCYQNRKPGIVCPRGGPSKGTWMYSR